MSNRSVLSAELEVTLVEKAREAAQDSYSPYSKFRVGAALLCADGTIYQGTNVENRSFGLTICAERSAIFSAVSAGNREFAALVVYNPNTNQVLPPCGACRQVLSEFADQNFPVIMAHPDGRISKTLTELLPMDSLHELKDNC